MQGHYFFHVVTHNEHGQFHGPSGGASQCDNPGTWLDHPSRSGGNHALRCGGFDGMAVRTNYRNPVLAHLARHLDPTILPIFALLPLLLLLDLCVSTGDVCHHRDAH